MSSIHLQSTVRFWLLTFLSVVASEESSYCAEVSDNWAYRLILDDHLESNPWRESKPIILCQDEIERRSNADREYWTKWITEKEYNPKTDFLKVPGWLAAARKGDYNAVHKLNSYIHDNPKWRHRFEIRKMLSDKQGAAGVAGYYA